MTWHIRTSVRLLAMTASVVASMSCDNGPVEPTFGQFAIERVLVGPRYGKVLVRGDTAFTARTDGLMEAVTISGGRTLWSARLRSDGVPLMSPSAVLTRDLLVIGVAGRVIALRRSDGSEAWRYEDPARPTLADYEIATDSDYVSFGEQRGRATALNARTGAIVWQRQLMADDPQSATRGLLFIDGLLVLQRNRSSVDAADGEPLVFAVRAATGEAVWTVRVNRAALLDNWGGQSTVAGPGRIVFALKSGRIFSVSPADGAVQWTAAPLTTSPGDFRDLVVSGTQLLASCVTAPAGVQALRLSDGAQEWFLESPVGAAISGLAVSPGQVSYSAFGGQLLTIDRTTRRASVIDADAVRVSGVGAVFFPTPVYAGKLLLAPTSEGLVVLRPRR